MKRKSIRALTVLCMTLSILMFGGIRASAGSYKSCSLAIPFTVEDISNKIPLDTSFEVEIEAKGKAPLPQNTVIRTDVNGSYTTDSITFDQPGTYSYTVSIRNIEGTDSNIHADKNVYDLNVYVFSRDDGSLYFSVTVYQNGSQLKSDNAQEIEGGLFMLSFQNRYGSANANGNDNNDSSQGDKNGNGSDNSPGTGEADWSFAAFGAMIGSCALFLLVCLRLLRARSKEQKEACAVCRK